MLELTNNPEVLASLGVQYIASKGLVYRESTDSQINVEVCPLCKHDGWHFFMCYAGNKDGLFACHRCAATGNLRSLQEKLGDKIAGVQSRREWAGKEKKIDALPDVDAAHAVLLGDADAMDYLLNTRGFTQEIIERQRIGLLEKHWFKSAGEVRALVIPYLVGDNCIFVKYRTLPPAPKDFNAPTGWDVPLFNGEILKPGLNEIIFTEGECLTGDTEVLTPEGWVRLDAYSGQQVTQWHKDGTASFTQPLAYVRKEYTGELISFSTKSKVIDLETTVQHNVLYNHYATGVDHTQKAADVPKTGVSFYRTAKLDAPGIAMSDADIRLYVAIQADANLENSDRNKEYHTSDGQDGWRMEFSKARKITRIRRLLKECGIEFTSFIAGRGTSIFRFRAPAGKFSKIFHTYLYQMNTRQRALFAEEVGYWDAHKRRGEVNYQSRIKENADLVQWSFSMSGTHATQGLYTRPLPRHDIYWVRVNTARKRGRQHLTCGHITKTTRQFSGMVYCVQVPSSFIVTRRSGAICVTGNCDALALMSQGVENVVGIPGASMKKAAWITELDDIAPERIYILFDNDKAGSKGAQELAARIGIDRCLKLSLPDLKYTEDGAEKHCKDVNDFFAKCGGTVAQFEELKAGAKQFDVTGVTSTGDALEELKLNLQGKDSLLPTYSTPWPSLNAKVGFENGDVVDIMAEAKTGKSSLSLNLLEHVVNTYNEPGLFLCLEMTQMRLARKWVSYVTQTDDSVPKTLAEGKVKLKAMLAAVDKAREIAANREADLYFAYPQITEAEDVYKLIRQCHRRYGIQWCVVDNLQLLCDKTLKNANHRTIHLSQISKALAGIAKDLNIKMIRILQPHQIKEGSMISARNADGSSQISKDCDCLILLHRNPVGDTKTSTFESAGILDTETAMDARMLVTVALSRYSAGGSCTLEFVGGTSTVREYTQEGAAAIPTRDPSLIQSREVVKPLFTLPAPRTATHTGAIATQIPARTAQESAEEITI